MTVDRSLVGEFGPLAPRGAFLLLLLLHPQGQPAIYGNILILLPEPGLMPVLFLVLQQTVPMLLQ